MEKVKSFIIFILTIALFTTYFMNLWMDNRKLNKTINDLESTVRVYQIIEKTGKNGG